MQVQIDFESLNNMLFFYCKNDADVRDVSKSNKRHAVLNY